MSLVQQLKENDFNLEDFVKYFFLVLYFFLIFRILYLLKKKKKTFVIVPWILGLY